nr:cyclin-dependent kinase inhibitor 1B-like [Paramormyrops kingsleyae]
MSDVRLSSSPTLERMDVRLSDHSKSRACRCLFGPIDHGELKKDQQELQRLQEETAARKWNYDFARDRPLAGGAYDWTAVNSCDLPEFYSRGHPGAGVALPSASAADADLRGQSHCQEGDAKGSAEAAEKPDEQMDYRNPREKSITRKRPGSKESPSQSKKSRRLLGESSQCSAVPLEVTPRKSKT